jgi:hypothetical protein
MVKYLFPALVLVVGCASEARLPASYFAESPKALRPGEVAVTGAAGGGGTLEGAGGGGGARVRVGIGSHQEVGVEAAAIALDSPSHHCSVDCEPGDNSRYTITGGGAMLSWKLEREHYSLVAGLGGSAHHRASGDPYPSGDYRGSSVTASLGAITSRPLTDTLTLYGGGRLSAAIPVTAPTMSLPDPLLSTWLGAGLSLPLGERLTLYAEAGPRITGPASDRALVESQLGVTAVAGLGLRL